MEGIAREGPVGFFSKAQPQVQEQRTDARGVAVTGLRGGMPRAVAPRAGCGWSGELVGLTRKMDAFGSTEG